MRRLFAFGVAWLAAAVVATVVAWQGVGLIGDQVTGKQSATLSASEIDAALSRSGTTARTPRSSTSTAPRRPTTAAAPRTTAGAAGGTAPSAGTQPAGGTPAPSSPTTPGPAATAPRASPILQTYRMVGGTTTISFTPTAVRMVSATPSPGYQLLRSGPGDNGGWRVEFEGDAGRSRVDAWWAGGPQHRVREDPAGGGGSGKAAPADGG